VGILSVEAEQRMPGRANRPSSTIDRVSVSAYRIPTSLPESDGTYAWNSTTLIVVEATASGRSGLGYTYADASTATLISDLLGDIVRGREVFEVRRSWDAMVHAVRNLGRPGIASMAIAAVDVALWDLKAKLLDLPLVSLLGAARSAVPMYGSGGFTSYSIDQLQEQLAGWVRSGIARVKMKVGTHAEDDARRVRAAREAIGAAAELFVDANGAYSRKQALELANRFAEVNVRWFEEPVPSDDLEGLRLLRDRAPAGMDIAAGEYGYDLIYFRRMLAAGAVDVLQADATRCAGITGFLQVAALGEAFGLALSSHCAPALHLHVCCAAPGVRHMEYFHDHARIEQMLFEGAARPERGELAPDLSRPGMGLELRKAKAAEFAV
jgi:L-alanine-DL-glutamate epimerase-like enolase superfamily enzyme